MPQPTVTPEIQALQTKKAELVQAGITLLKPYEQKGAPPEIMNQFKGIAGQLDGINATIAAYQQLNAAAANGGSTGAGTLPVAWRPAAGNEGDELPIDAKSWRTFEVKDAWGRSREFRYNVPIAVSRDPMHERVYRDGFELYTRKGQQHVRDNYPTEWKALSEGTDTAGGFSVPVDFHAELIKKTAMYGMVRPNARVIQTDRDLVTFPRIKYDAAATDDSGNKRFTSPVRMTWTGELPASSTVARVTDQIFGQYEIKVNTAIASQLLSNDLIEDAAFDIAGYASDTMAEAFALGEDYAFLQGTGVAQPTGLVTSVGLSGGPGYTVSGTSADITTSGDAYAGLRITNTYYALPAQYRRNAIWLMSSITMQGVENLVDANKRPLISSLIGGANISVGQPEQIKGRPIMVDEFMPDYNAANALGLVIGDFKGYLIADRVQFSVQRYTELYVETNFTLLLARKRVGGLCIEPWKFNFLKSGTS
jgi:HK97 family phage major capsid protein